MVLNQQQKKHDTVPSLTFSYSVSETVDRQDIDGIREPPPGILPVGRSLATDSAPDEPCTVAY